MTIYLIEKGTNYSYLLDTIKHPTFEGIRRLSVNFVNQLPEEVKTNLWVQLENGVQLLDSEALKAMLQSLQPSKNSLYFKCTIYFFNPLSLCGQIIKVVF